MRSLTPSRLVVTLLAALCTAAPGASPEAEADAMPQFTNNAPFSGAIYLVNGNGQQVTAQNTNYCPSSASQSCSSINAPSWCCPANYACVVPANSNGLLGCCPAGSSCGGAVNAAAITTVTVYAQPETTYIQKPTAVQGGFCATITMDGPGLPKAADGQCGTVLLVAEGVSLKFAGAAVSVTAVVLHIAIGRFFR